MKISNNKGFTLVELIATIVLLAIVMGIGAYSITKIIENSREKNYKLLVTEIRTAAEGYYQECRFADGDVNACYYDFDFDGEFNNEKDSEIVKDCINGNDKSQFCKYVKQDYNGDGRVNSNDASYVLNGGMVVRKNSFFTTLDVLIKYGYLNGNDKDSDNNQIITNTKNENSIGGCIIYVEYDGGLKITNVGSINGTLFDDCPTYHDGSINNDLENDVNINNGNLDLELNDNVVNGDKKIILKDKLNGAACAQGMDNFYQDYCFNCQMSQYMYVIVNGTEYLLTEALNNGTVTIEELQKNNITFKKCRDIETSTQ